MTSEITAPSRRTITKGAAWAAPAVAVAATAPSLAASPIDCDGMGGTFSEVTPGTYTVTIPDCITRIQYVVRGGGGGGAGPGSSARGAGAEIAGSLALVPGASRTLTLIVADGGGISSTGLAAGGSGYGRGGRGSNAANSGPNGRSFGGGGGVQAKFINNVTETISLTSTHAASGFPFGDRTAGGTSGNALGMGVMAVA